MATEKKAKEKTFQKKVELIHKSEFEARYLEFLTVYKIAKKTDHSESNLMTKTCKY
jgi:hypothetical protein